MKLPVAMMKRIKNLKNKSTMIHLLIWRLLKKIVRFRDSIRVDKPQRRTLILKRETI